MFTEANKRQIEGCGMTTAQVEHQLEQVRNGFPFLHIEAAAAVGDGIMAPDEAAQAHAVNAWEVYKQGGGHRVVKFVPASGAASRMFKNLFTFLNADYDVPTTDFEKYFFDEIKRFAFYEALDEKCQENNQQSIEELIQTGNYKAVVANMLTPQGLNYGQLPKGLLLFHNYSDGSRTPMEEHLVEGARYAAVDGQAQIHFTVSHDHLVLFQNKVAEKLPYFEQKFGIKFDVSFSEQKPSTDTIATNLDNTPFLNSDNSLLFRPGGHGALIENLNDIDADVVFIKNIDNVVPDRLKEDTVLWKQIIAGVLVETQQKAFDYLHLLDSGKYSHDQLLEIIRFVQRVICCRYADTKNLEDAELVLYLRKKLNRPMRVCGVVKNVGEPGGGPFLAYNSDGSVSPQILESSQIDKNNAEYMNMFTSGTHFNPVDLVCAIKDYKGQPFNLLDFVDHNTGFISNKSKDGRELKALELPGLWNGAMSDWNTVFVEVPLATFNPVKTVNDLLRDVHQ
ncbi:MAG: DUF4301 family protein [Prevotella sp.]